METVLIEIVIKIAINDLKNKTNKTVNDMWKAWGIYLIPMWILKKKL